MLELLSSALNKVIKYVLNVFSPRRVPKDSQGYSTIQLIYDNYIVDSDSDHSRLVPGVVKVVFNRPLKKNAFNERMYKELIDAFQQISKDDHIHTCILTGNGDFYSSGNDLANFTASIMHPLSMARKARRICQEVVEAFITFKKPLVVVVNGPAIGLAVTSLGLCDRVYAVESAYFKTPFASLGISPEGCSTFTFPRIMGEKIAHEVLWEGKVLSAREALQCRLIHGVLSTKSDAENEALKHCEKIASSDGMESRRCLVRDGLVDELLEVNTQEQDVLERKFVSKDFFAKTAAFLEQKKMITAAIIVR